jgi:hypothetical protein
VVGADGDRPREELLARTELFLGYFDVAPWVRNATTPQTINTIGCPGGPGSYQVSSTFAISAFDVRGSALRRFGSIGSRCSDLSQRGLSHAP